MSEKGYKTIKFSDFEAFGQSTKITNVDLYNDLYNFDFVNYVQKFFLENMGEQISIHSRKVARTLLNIDVLQMSDDELDRHLDFACLGSCIIVYWDGEYLFRFDIDYSYDGNLLTVKCRVTDYRLLERKGEEDQ